MTRDDTVALVERVWASWGVDLPAVVRRQTYDAWYRIVHDLDATLCARALDELVIEDRPWPPRPGTVRRRVLDMAGVTGDGLPSATEAWAQLQSRADAVRHVEDFEPLHPLVAKVAAQMGVSPHHLLHTNGDREMFVRRYEEAVANETARRYQVER